MKIVLVGATGTIGQHVKEELAKRHKVISASIRKGEVKVDITSKDSIKAMFEAVGRFDALVVAAGGAHVGPLAEMREEDFYKGIKSKMMGQINLVLIGQHYIKDQGSFTLTSGILSEDPIRYGVNLTVVNSAINGFAIAAANELLSRGIRINVVSPALLKESVPVMGELFPGHSTVANESVVRAYVKSVEGVRTGEIIKVY